MHRIDTSTAVATKPTPAAAGTPGYFGSAATTGDVATRLSADFMNSVQEELCAVIEGAGLTLSKTNDAQLLAAIRSMASSDARLDFAELNRAPYAAETVALAIMETGDTIPAGAPGCRIQGAANATTDLDLIIYRGLTTQIGTATIAAGTSVATISFAAAVQFAAGEFFSIVNQNATDATFTGLSILIVYTKAG